MNAVTDDLPSIAQQRAQVKAAEAAVQMARGQYWPTVDLTATRQLNPMTTGSVLSYKEDTLTQVQLNMPLYNGGATSAAVQTAVGQLKAAQYGLDEARLLAREKAALSYQEWMNAQGRATQGETQARMGDKVVEGYRQQFRLARRQLLDLLNIQAESFGYQSSAMTAIYDEQIARARMLAATGDLAKRF
jgi:adhesin transport system outer membrane protein